MGLNEEPRMVRVDIGELALSGFDARIDPDQVGLAFQTELTRLIEERGVPLVTTGADRALGILSDLPRSPPPPPRPGWARPWPGPCTRACPEGAGGDMSNAPSTTQDDRGSQSAKRRKRKERTGRTRTPEPKDIVSGAGQPVDPSVRRDLEEQLGHDLGQVRLHTDRDAGHLTELLGADAVAVGQDIFFRENTYRPGTTEGQRLLAHELLHTVQNPHGLGTLRAGRDLGAVSLPQQAVEREAEDTAQELVRGGQPETHVDPEQSATPGWLRYATVDADRNRMEKLDPATLVDRLAGSVVRSLRGDPEDRSKRTRMQLARMPDEVQDAVLDRLETRLLSSEHERVLDFVDEIEADDNLERESLDAPDVEPDPVEELLFERETQRRRAEERREEERRPAPAPGPERDQPAGEGAPGSTPQNGGGAPEKEGQGGSQEQRPGTNGGREGGSPASGGKSGGSASAAAPRPQPPSQQPSGGGQPGGEKKAEGSEKGREGKEAKEGKDGKEGEGKEGQEQQGVATPSKEESAAKNRPGAVDSLVAGQQLKQQDKRGADKPTGSPMASGKDTQSPGAFSTLDGVRAQDLDGPEERAEEDPFGSGSESEVEVGGAEKSAWDIKLQPEDFLPEQDLDVSGVPTADTLDPASSADPPVPSFPAPPLTKADKVQAERDAEDAEDEAEDAEPEEDAADSAADAEPSAEADDGAAAAGAGLGGLAVEQAAESRPGPAVTRDPKSGADPKDGPVVAQTTVQEAAGRSEDGSEATEQAAKEEKGTSAAGDASGGGQEKASPQAVGGQAAQEPAAKEEQKKADTAPAAKSEPTADAQSPSPARDTQVTGGSNADTPGGASSGAQSGQGAPAERTETPAAESAPPAPEPKKSAEPEQTPAPAAAPPKETPAPKAAPGAKVAAPKSAPSAKTPGGGGGGGGGGGKASAPAKGKKKDSGPAPNLSQVSPEAGLSTASKLKPHVALQAMTGVSGSVNRTVGDEHKALAAAPPSMQRPAGAPQTLQGKPKTAAPAQYSQDPAQKSEAPEKEDAKVTGAKEPGARSRRRRPRSPAAGTPSRWPWASASASS
ncbi:hypothetical protein SVIO_017010 [Streptomyces violaceusniger]|uniref:eCIS core domain-containing protein n=1 Tax=Streptomyces violaceusniger TaxID=68280 RepID=A0A4D4KXK2_STRVO|nr:hypothetical protein SVIO_017010 [Streptomyces violaceusniger]